MRTVVNELLKGNFIKKFARYFKQLVGNPDADSYLHDRAQ